MKKMNLGLAAGLLFMGVGSVWSQTTISPSFQGEFGSIDMSSGSIQIRSSGPQTGASTLSAGTVRINSGFWFAQLSLAESEISPLLVSVSSEIGPSGGDIVFHSPNGSVISLDFRREPSPRTSR